MHSLTFEAFKGIGKLKELNFYQYRILGKGEIDNEHKVIWSVKYKLQASNKFKPVFVKEQCLYSLEQLNVIPEFDNVDIIPLGKTKLSLKENTEV